MYKCYLFGHLYETVDSLFYSIVRANRNELSFVQSYFKHLGIIHTYEHVYVLSFKNIVFS